MSGNIAELLTTRGRSDSPATICGDVELSYGELRAAMNGIASLLRREKVFAYRYEGRRYDCGSREGFLQANVELALEHPQLGAGFRDFLRGLPL